MKKEYLDQVLTLLAIVILIDDKVYPEEVETFSKAVQKISEQIDPNILFTPSMASGWFRDNRESILRKLRNETSDSLIDSIIQKLRSYNGHKDVFFNMIRIAHADQEYHQTEHAVIKMASEAWNIPYSVEQAKNAH